MKENMKDKKATILYIALISFLYFNTLYFAWIEWPLYSLFEHFLIIFGLSLVSFYVLWCILQTTHRELPRLLKIIKEI